MISFQINKYSDESTTGLYGADAPLIQKMLNAIAGELNEIITSENNSNIQIEVRILPGSKVGGIMSATANYSGKYTQSVNGSIPTPIDLTNDVQNKILTGISALLPNWDPIASTGNTLNNTSEALLNISQESIDSLTADVSNTGAKLTNSWAFSALLHETFHMLGFNGNLSPATGLSDGNGLYGGNWLSSYDKFVTVNGNAVTFSGSAAEAIFGGPVPLRPLGGIIQSIYHTDVLNAPPGTTGNYVGINSDLMNGSAFPWTLDNLNLNLDIAMLVDMGYTNMQTLTSIDGHTFIPGAGAQVVTGGAGSASNTVFYTGKLSGFHLQNTNGTIDVLSNTTPANHDTLTNITTLRFSDGNLTASLIGTDGNNTMVGTGTTDVFFGGKGNDTLTGATGSHDIAAYVGNAANYTITTTPTGLMVTDTTGGDGVDTLTNINRLWFGDKHIAFDVNGNAGDAYRLYQAAFDRTPDIGGLGYWMNVLDHGTSLKTVAEGFVGSAEFASLYGANPTNRELVNHFYANVLHRTPDQGGFNFWVNVLDKHLDTLGNVLVGFSQSPENQAQVIGTISHGMEYVPT